MKFEYTYTLPRDDARSRLEALGDYLSNRHKIAFTWNGDSATFSGRFKRIVKIAGRMQFGDDNTIQVDGEDPGRVWRGPAIRYIRRKLDAYLDPDTPIAELPRA